MGVLVWQGGEWGISFFYHFFSEMLYPPFSSLQEESNCFLLLHCSSILENSPDISTDFSLLNKHQYIQDIDNVVFTTQIEPESEVSTEQW